MNEFASWMKQNKQQLVRQVILNKKRQWKDENRGSNHYSVTQQGDFLRREHKVGQGNGPPSNQRRHSTFPTKWMAVNT